MRVWTDYRIPDDEAEEGGLSDCPGKLPAPWLGWGLAYIALATLLVIFFEAGSATEAQRTLDALAREHEADVRADYAVELLRQYLPEGEEAARLLRELDRELLFRIPPYDEASPLRRALDR